MAAFCPAVPAALARAAVPARSRPRSVRCQAAERPKAKPAPVSRREALKFGASTLPFLVAADAWAILPGNDDEDEELLAKAKAARTNRIQSERSLEKSFVRENNLKTDADVATVQIAVYKLSKAGEYISNGMLASAYETLQTGDWEKKLEASSANLGSSPSDFIDGVKALKAATMAGNESKTKSSYVSAVSALKSYAKAAGIEQNLKLL